MSIPAPMSLLSRGAGGAGVGVADGCGRETGGTGRGVGVADGRGRETGGAGSGVGVDVGVGWEVGTGVGAGVAGRVKVDDALGL